jgi:predicted Zn-ribbon and HTH transcriptional regulator
MPLACPKCGSRNLRPAHYRNNDERMNALRFIAPLRCKDCRTRFVSKTIFLNELFYARCPKCDRMDLNGWTGKTHQPRGWTAVKVALGAHKWRCEYCRMNFASFRNRKESFTFSRWKKRNPDLVAEKPAGVLADENTTAETTQALSERSNDAENNS